MSEHTKGLLRVGHSGAVVADHPIPEMSGSDATEYYGGHLVAESVTAANARRLAACWNLLHEFDTEAIEAGTFADFIGKQVYQPVGHADGRLFICLTSFLILAQHRICSAILLLFKRLRQRFGKGHHIAQPEVKALSGDRV